MTVLVAVLLAGAVLAWPSRRGRLPVPPDVGPPVRQRRRRGHRAEAGDRREAGDPREHRAGSPSPAAPAAVAGRRVRWAPRAGPLGALLHRRGSAAAREAGEEVVLQLVEAMVPALRAGLPPSRAVQLAAEVVQPAAPTGVAGPAEVGVAGPGWSWTLRHRAEDPVAREARHRLDGLLEAAAEGRPLGPLWHEWARASGGAPELATLARAWSLSERTGAPLADGVAAAGAAVRAARDTRRAVAAATAGARATMNLLTALPLGGVVVAATVGVDPVRLYSAPLAQGCLVLGGCLLVLGRWWVARLTRSAVSPERAT